MQFNSSSTGGSIESLSDAEGQAKEAKNQEGPRGGSQASEEAEEAKREDGHCGRPGKRTPRFVTICNYASLPPAPLCPKGFQ